MSDTTRNLTSGATSEVRLPEKLLLKVAEVAYAIGMSEGYVKAAIRAKQLPIVKHGRCTRIDIDDLKAWNTSRKIVGTTSVHDGSLTENPKNQVIEKTVGVR